MPELPSGMAMMLKTLGIDPNVAISTVSELAKTAQAIVTSQEQIIAQNKIIIEKLEKLETKE